MTTTQQQGILGLIRMGPEDEEEDEDEDTFEGADEDNGGRKED